MNYHPVSEKIKKLLEDNQMWFERFEHQPVRTSKEASQVRPNYSLSQGGKALIVRLKKDGEKTFAMIVVPGDKRFDVKAARKVLGASDIRFASEEEVDEITGGVVPGGVPPFGTIFGIPVYADRHIFLDEKMIFNAGDRSVSIGMKTEDYNTLVAPHIVDIC